MDLDWKAAGNGFQFSLNECFLHPVLSDLPSSLFNLHFRVKLPEFNVLFIHQQNSKLNPANNFCFLECSRYVIVKLSEMFQKGLFGCPICQESFCVHVCVNISFFFCGCMFWFTESSPNMCNVGSFGEALQNVPVWLY